MRRIIIILVVILFSSSASAWELKKSVDAMTDKVSHTVFVVSNDGSRFTLIRKSDNSVWGYIELVGMNQFMVNERLLLRVDTNPPKEQNNDFNKMMASLGLSDSAPKMWEWNPNLIGFRIWHGKIDEGCGYIQELFEGKKLVIRYHPNQSTTKDVYFDISKNKAAIPTALGIDMDQCGK